MKISLALGPRGRLSRESAWGCFTTNLAVPGMGSLMAGRVVGYVQMFFAFGGFGLTLALGVRFFAWYLTNSSRLRSDYNDPFENFRELWNAMRWPLLGIALFGLGWLWAVITSLQVLSEARQQPKPGEQPPKLR